MRTDRISDYALIGDTRTAALCSRDGSIDWLCLPRFDSEPVFGRLVGGASSGSFSITPADLVETDRRYRTDSAILETRWRTGSGAALLTEGMVAELGGTLRPQALVVRHVRCIEGSVALRIRFDPKFGLPGRAPHAQRRNGMLVCTWGSLALGLSSRPELEILPGVDHSMQLRKGQALTLVLAVADKAPLVRLSSEAALAALWETDEWWLAWTSRVQLDGAWRESVVRSLITLRLLTYAPSGAPVAAPTTSLPEAIGGTRNWDYRLAWPRDAAIGVAAFLAAGMHQEANSFMQWLLHASRLTRPRLNVLYTIFGRPGPREKELWDVEGYRGSLPVRIGNAASLQHQLDVYGWVVDAAYLLDRAGHRLDGETWRTVRGFIDFVVGAWDRPDAGIWEVRGESRHYVHSKLMAWLALDRGLRMAASRREGRRAARWREARDALAAEIASRGFNEGLGAYVWSYGSDQLDAALLILPVIEFEAELSVRTRQTIEAIREGLGAGRGLLYRYPPRADGMEGDEGGFLPCSFWLVQALARTGRVEEATELFELLLQLQNDVGLLAEEADPRTGELLGNFPQAFTHATLIQAALALDEAQAREGLRAA